MDCTRIYNINAGIIASRVHGDATILMITAAPQRKANCAHLFIAVGNF